MISQIRNDLFIPSAYKVVSCVLQISQIYITIKNLNSNLTFNRLINRHNLDLIYIAIIRKIQTELEIDVN
jgi:hypothetical protein